MGGRQKSQVSLSVFLTVVISLFLIGGGLSAFLSVQNFLLKRELQRYDYSEMYDLIETNFELSLPAETKVFDYYTGEGQDGLHEVVYCSFVIPNSCLFSFEYDIKQLNWMEYTSDMYKQYETISALHPIWFGLWRTDAVEQDIQRGYILFLDNQGSDIELFYSDGSAMNVDDAVLFYDPDTGRLTFYTQTMRIYLH